MQEMNRNKNTEAFRRKLAPKSFWKKPWVWMMTFALMILAAVAVYQIPSIHDRAAFHLGNARARIFYFFNPPGKDVFVPVENENSEEYAIQTLTAMAPTATMTPTPQEPATETPTLEFTATPTIIPTNTPIPTPLPRDVLIEGIDVEYQKANNCGPANLSMILNYWGWEGDQTDTEKVLKPYIKDRNVMPYEMLDFVQTQTQLNGIVRYGGDIDLVRKLVAAGFPVVFERGYVNRSEGWMGHYGLIVGYDDVTREVTIPDTYLGLIKLGYDDLEMWWAQFDFIYLVVFPNERAQEVYDILGPQMDAEYNKQYTLDKVNARLYEQKERELFFAWYSRGSILVEMNDYWGAADSFDEAFKIYATLPEEERPWRMLWYQTGPYYSYYYMMRYQDLYNLADQQLKRAEEPALPETWVWKGRAEVKLGLREQAIESFKQALVWHPDWWVAVNELNSLGVTVP